jgi:hypothetical protein
MYDVLRLQKSALGYGLLTKRCDWPRVRSELESLTADKINNAINAVSNHQPITDSTINSLLQLLRSVGTYDPHSFASKMARRAKMKGVAIRRGITDIWLTLNPSDFRNSLILQLAGIEIVVDAMPSAAAAVRDIPCTSNPVAVAEIFRAMPLDRRQSHPILFCR